jgi:hypothetical protein
MRYDRQNAQTSCPELLYAIVPVEKELKATIGSNAAFHFGMVMDGAFAAVVSDGDGGLCSFHNQVEISNQLRAYQGAIDSLRQSMPLLPVKFGTLLPDESTVQQVLAQGRRAFAAAFGRLKDCVQMEIVVRWNLDPVFAEIAQKPNIADFRRNHSGGEDREALGRLVKISLEQRRTALALELYGKMKSLAVDTILQPTATDDVVLHLVLLIKSADIDKLYECLESLDKAHKDLLAFRCIGPLAPYSFATVEITLVKATRIAEAQRLLGLSPHASCADVRTAYHRLVKNVHPDVAIHAGGTGSDAITALQQACQLLLQCAETDIACTQSTEAAPVVVFVAVRRQESVYDLATI